MKPKLKTWTSTRIPQLYRHSSGMFYARLKVAGKPTWRSLKTELQSVAKVELAKLVDEEASRSELHGNEQVNPRLTMGEAKKIRLREIDNDVAMKKATRHYWKQISVALFRSWPELEDLEARKITPAMCQDWAGKFVKASSSTRYNNSVSFLRQLFEIGIRMGARAANPAMKVKRVRQKSKDLASRLPNKEQFGKWVSSIRHAGGGFSQNSADFVEFLAYSGVRKGEAKFITWDDVDAKRGEIIVRGDPEEATKNSETRRIPIISAMAELLDRIRGRRPNEESTSKILRVNESQKSMDHAAKKIGMKRVTHHDLRHLFATTCIESGVDIPTVSKWLGHKDGGVLAMKVYGLLPDGIDMRCLLFLGRSRTATRKPLEVPGRDP